MDRGEMISDFVIVTKFIRKNEDEITKELFQSEVYPLLQHFVLRSLLQMSVNKEDGNTVKGRICNVVREMAKMVCSGSLKSLRCIKEKKPFDREKFDKELFIEGKQALSVFLHGNPFLQDSEKLLFVDFVELFQKSVIEYPEDRVFTEERLQSFHTYFLLFSQKFLTVDLAQLETFLKIATVLSTNCNPVSVSTGDLPKVLPPEALQTVSLVVESIKAFQIDMDGFFTLLADFPFSDELWDALFSILQDSSIFLQKYMDMRFQGEDLSGITKRFKSGGKVEETVIQERFFALLIGPEPPSELISVVNRHPLRCVKAIIRPIGELRKKVQEHLARAKKKQEETEMKLRGKETECLAQAAELEKKQRIIDNKSRERKNESLYQLNQLEKKQVKIDSLNERVGALEMENKNLYTQVWKLSIHSTSKQQLEENQVIIDTLNERVGALEMENENLGQSTKQQLEEKQVIIDTLNERVGGLESTVEKLTKQLEEKRQEVEKLKKSRVVLAPAPFRKTKRKKFTISEEMMQVEAKREREIAMSFRRGTVSKQKPQQQQQQQEVPVVKPENETRPIQEVQQPPTKARRMLGPATPRPAKTQPTPPPQQRELNVVTVPKPRKFYTPPTPNFPSQESGLNRTKSESHMSSIKIKEGSVESMNEKVKGMLSSTQLVRNVSERVSMMNKSMAADKAHTHKSCVVVRNIPAGITAQAVQGNFVDCGDVLKVEFERKNNLCLVFFSTYGDMNEAVKRKVGATWGDNKIEVLFARNFHIRLSKSIKIISLFENPIGKIRADLWRWKLGSDSVLARLVQTGKKEVTVTFKETHHCKMLMNFDSKSKYDMYPIPDFYQKAYEKHFFQIVVENLPAEFVPKFIIKKLFADCGMILDIYYRNESVKMQKRSAIVQFSSIAEVGKALRKNLIEHPPGNRLTIKRNAKVVVGWKAKKKKWKKKKSDRGK